MPKRDRSIFARLLALLAVLAFVAAACGGSDNKTNSAGGTKDTTASDKTGGEIVDLGTFQGDPPQHIDPGLNSTLDAYQVINELYDGLTDIDASDPANPKIKPLVAESVDANADATVWTFVIRKGAQFSNGEPVLPSSFQRAWERASNKDFAGDYSYLFNFIKGGAEKLAGTADKLAGVAVDDATRTLTVTLAKPYSNFDAVAGFQIFFPMPKAVDALTDQKDWENGVMIGNGPYKMESARTSEQIVLVRNDKWGGDVLGNKTAILDKVTFKVSKDVDTAYNAFEAGEGDTANIPPGRVKEADDNYGTTLDVNILGSYHYDVNQTDPSIGGAKNLKLREAFSMAINRDEINKAVFDSSRTVSTGITPPGIPGFKSGLCGDLCKYDPVKAKAALAEWTAAGNKQSGPIKIQFNAENGHEPVVAIMVDNLKAVGIQAVADPRPTETYFSSLAKGACVVCRAGWFADYPTYDNFMYDLFHKDAIGGNNYSKYDNPEFNSLVDEAKQTVDKDKQGQLFNQAETLLLKDVGVIPVLWYRGDYVYNDKKFTNFQQTNFGLILWDQIKLK
ncbi:MAG: ABC-type oligopeptide transport system, periplasmic component [Actinomycetia bacterium]|nr:ABC-type oligopeptide transport system, periplasmic component [Actinomycetes bacterium]